MAFSPSPLDFCKDWSKRSRPSTKASVGATLSFSYSVWHAHFYCQMWIAKQVSVEIHMHTFISRKWVATKKELFYFHTFTIYKGNCFTIGSVAKGQSCKYEAVYILLMWIKMLQNV